MGSFHGHQRAFSLAASGQFFMALDNRRQATTSTIAAASRPRPPAVTIPVSCCPWPAPHRDTGQRRLLSTHQGAVDREHLAEYLDEFVFRFNRRTSRSRGLVFMRVLQLAVGHDPVRYRELIRRPRETPPVPPGATGHPPRLERPRPDRPWRRPYLHDSG